MKKFGMTLLLLLFVPSALAGLSISKMFTNGDAQVTVISTVSELTDGYLYTYQITDIGDLNISLFAVPFSTPLTKPSEIDSFGHSDAPVTLLYWDVIGIPAVAAHAFFAPSPLTDEGSSLILSFESIYDAEEVQGYVNDAKLGTLHGNLLAPAPEPLTFSLLAVGVGIIIRKRQKN